MSQISENNRRIVRNTLILYGRMVMVMGVSLFTSRIVLQSLGIDGYGLYSVIGGVVALFGIISGSLSSAVSRFITYELGRGDLDKLKMVFSSSLVLQLFLAAIVLIVLTPLSAWFVGARMQIPVGDTAAAYCVLFFSIATFCLNLLSVPYNAVLVSHENMRVFSYISVLEAGLKLGVAYMISVFADNRLIIYAGLLFLISLGIQGSYMVYCGRHYNECRTGLRLNRNLLRELGGFAGWNFIGATAAILRTQGNNVILNLFFGTVINAAYGLAMQVSAVVNQLADNFMISVNPQITKYYAAGSMAEMKRLVERSASLAFYLTWLISAVILLNTRYILTLWLSDVPHDTVLFVQLIMICAISDSFSRPLITAMLATGRIRDYQLVVGGMQLLNLPLSYVALRLGGAPWWPLLMCLIISQISLVARLIMLRPLIGIDVKAYLKSVYLKALLVIVATLVPTIAMQRMAGPAITFGGGILQSLAILGWTLGVILYLGLNVAERAMIATKIKGLISKFIHS